MSASSLLSFLDAPVVVGDPDGCLHVRERAQRGQSDQQLFRVGLREREQPRRVLGLGDDAQRSIDVRIVAATVRDLDREVAQGQFREDLFYRINVLELTVPPLRVRGNDVLLLANHYYKKFADHQKSPLPGLDEQALKKLLAYDWPGNVRELKNVMERAVVLAGESKVSVDVLPEKISSHKPSRIVIDDDQQPLSTLETIQNRYIQLVKQKTSL